MLGTLTLTLALVLASPPPTEPAVIRVAQVEAEPTIQARRVLVLRDPATALEVREYHVDGALVKAVGMDGTPLVMRAEKVDLPESEKRSAHAQREAERILAEQVEAQRAADEEAERRAEIRERNAEQRRTSTRRPGVSYASGSAFHNTLDSSTTPEVEPVPGGAGGSAPAQASSGGGRSRLDALRGRYKAKRAEAASKRAQADKALQDRNALIDSTGHYRTGEGVQLGAGLLRDADRYQQEAKTADAEADRIKTEFATVQEEIRKSGADAAEWRGGIEG